MTVINLQAGNVLDVAANQIRRSAHVYRTNQGYDSPGNVGWQPNAGALQMQALAVGQTATFAINGQAGMIANGCPGMVQVLYDNTAPLRNVSIRENAALRLLGARRTSPTRAGFAASGNSTPAEQAMSVLNSQWYNAVVTGCRLDAATFQLFQGSAPIGATSEIMWNIMDVVPPLSVSNYYNPSQANVFSTDYGAVINNLKPQNAQAFQNDMGDYYPQWTAYLKTVTTLPAGAILALFQTWSQLHMPPDQAQQAYTAFQEVSQGVVPVAVQMWLNAGGGTGGTKAYNSTIAQLQSALQAAQPVSFNLDTSTESSDVSHTWAQVEAGGIFDIFAGEGSSSYDHLTMVASQAGLSIDVTFQRLVTFPLGPLSKTSTDPILSQYQPWYNSAALNLAYQNNNNLVWNNVPPTWANTFGPGGNMLRTASALIVVDGVTMNMTSNNAFSSSDATSFKAAASVGFWPFFEAEGSGGWSNDVNFDSKGFMTITSTSPLGNPITLGVIVTPIGGALLIT